MSELYINDHFNNGTGSTAYFITSDSSESYSNQISSLSNDIVTLSTTVDSISSGMNISYGRFTKNTGDASGSNVYTHNLGRVPRWIEFVSSTSPSFTSTKIIGYYDVTNNTNNLPSGVVTYCVYSNYVNGSLYYQQGQVISATSTDFTISWDRGGTTTPQNGYVLFKVIG